MTVLTAPASDFEVCLARSENDLRAAQRLRYEVFVEELGGNGPMVDHANRLEQDHLDGFFDHMILRDLRRSRIAGVYRLMRAEQAQAAGGFYSASEFDLTPLVSSGRSLLELGRSCLHKEYRGGAGLHHLWSGLAAYVARHRIEVLFGVASFHGTDVQALAQPLSLLHHRHLADPKYRVQALEKARHSMDLIDEDCLDRKAAMLQIPGLIRSYLRLGGTVGEGAFVDHAFNTTDVCLVLDTQKLDARQARLYAGKG